jgi:hypothetical protein
MKNNINSYFLLSKLQKNKFIKLKRTEFDGKCRNIAIEELLYSLIEMNVSLRNDDLLNSICEMDMFKRKRHIGSIETQIL